MLLIESEEGIDSSLFLLDNVSIEFALFLHFLQWLNCVELVLGRTIICFLLLSLSFLFVAFPRLQRRLISLASIDSRRLLSRGGVFGWWSVGLCDEEGLLEGFFVAFLFAGFRACLSTLIFLNLAEGLGCISCLVCLLIVLLVAEGANRLIDQLVGVDVACALSG